jgi:hypothetical protein
MEPWHGTINGYNNHKCRCRPCKDAHNAHFREYSPKYRQERRKRDPRFSASGCVICCDATGCHMPDAKWHGTAGGYANHYCRCKPCTIAGTERRRQQKGRRSCTS